MYEKLLPSTGMTKVRDPALRQLECVDLIFDEDDGEKGCGLFGAWQHS